MQMCCFRTIFQHPYNCDELPETMLVLTVSELNTSGNRTQRNYRVVTQSLKQVTLNIRRLQKKSSLL